MRLSLEFTVNCVVIGVCVDDEYTSEEVSLCDWAFTDDNEVKVIQNNTIKHNLIENGIIMPEGPL